MLAKFVIQSELFYVESLADHGACLHGAQVWTRLHHDSVEWPALIKLLLQLVFVGNDIEACLVCVDFAIFSQGRVIVFKTCANALYTIRLVHPLTMSHDSHNTILELRWLLRFRDDLLNTGLIL